MTYSKKGFSRALLGIGLSLAALGLTQCDSSDASGHAGGASGSDAGSSFGGSSAGEPGSGGAAPHGGAASGGSLPVAGAGGASAGAAGEAGTGGEAGVPWTQFFSGEFARKAVASRAGAAFALLEKTGVLHVDYGSPRRRLVKVATGGEVHPWLSTAPSESDASLLDFALHPSGEITALFASSAGYRLVRLNANGEVVNETAISDPQIGLDAPALPESTPSAPIEIHTHDTGRVQPLGEQVVLATRTGRHSVIAYRYDFRDAHFEQETRTLIVPPVSLIGVGLNGGSHDTFGQLDAQFAVHVAVDEAPTIYVAVQHPHGGNANLVKAHQRVFGEELVGDPDSLDLYVTRVSVDGTRLGTSVVGTPEEDELYGLRGGKNAAYVAGRKEYWNESGTGFDALAAEVDGATGAVRVFELDVDRSDIAFDVAPLSESELLLVGASGYTQNPHGASVSEESQGFAYVLATSGGVRALLVPNRQRHNEVRALARTGDGGWLAVGMLHGPGTHSGDADASRISADGFLATLEVQGPLTGAPSPSAK